MKPAGMHRKEGPAGQRGSLFKGSDVAGRPAGFIPPGDGWRRAMPRHLQLSRRGAPLLLAFGSQSRSLRHA
jgi:hypothetical protein